MAGRPLAKRVLKLAGVMTLVLLTTATATAHAQYSNPAPIAVPAGSLSDPGGGSLYPSTIEIADLLGTVQRVTVALNGVRHEAPDDLEILVVAPNGQRTMLMDSDCGFDELPSQTFRFDDAATFALPDSGCAGGPYKPSYEDAVALPLPAPPPPYPGVLTALAGSPPSGTWRLFPYDSAPDDGGWIDRGWRLTFTLVGACDGEQATAVESEPRSTRTGTHILTGTDGDDVLLGTNGEDTIKGLGGDDLICGAGKKDKIRGGSGRDVLRGEDGRDSLNGEGGRDKLLGGGASDKLVGQSGKDRLSGQAGKDSCRGGRDKDRAKSCEKEKSL